MISSVASEFTELAKSIFGCHSCRLAHYLKLLHHQRFPLLNPSFPHSIESSGIFSFGQSYLRQLVICQIIQRLVTGFEALKSGDPQKPRQHTSRRQSSIVTLNTTSITGHMQRLLFDCLLLNAAYGTPPRIKITYVPQAFTIHNPPLTPPNNNYPIAPPLPQARLPSVPASSKDLIL